MAFQQTTIAKFCQNTSGRDYCIGDLHGMYSLLMQELIDVDFDAAKDRVFAVGDLIDRGPQSMKCLDLLFEPWFFSCMGNHEEMMLECVLRGDNMQGGVWVRNGGDWAVLNHHAEGDWDETFVETLEAVEQRLPLAMEVQTKYGPVGILHADPPGTWDEALMRDLRMNTLWGRNRINRKDSSIVEDIYKVYVGHTPQRGVVRLGNVWYIDTCANAKTGELTMLRIN